MNKREFIKSTALAGLAAALPFGANAAPSLEKIKVRKHWIWINPGAGEEARSLSERYQKYHDAGIRAVLFESDSEAHFIAAKSAGLEAHRWMWTLNRGEKSLLRTHPEWYAVSRNGESCALKPPYVDYYRWLCPSRPETKDYLEGLVERILQKEYVDGIHLDYIRFCDVILPVNLWEKYSIEQTRELPEYDFCYCEICRTKFKNQKGIDPLDLEYPDQSLSWRKFRYDQVAAVVNRLAQTAASFGKPITAAVFPTPEVARRLVRQDWGGWDLNAVMPMIYHGFYKEDIAWIGDAVAEGVAALCGRFPLYAGLFLPDFKDAGEFKRGARYALDNGAAGISIFGKANDDILLALSELS